MSVSLDLDKDLSNADWVKKSNDRMSLFVTQASDQERQIKDTAKAVLEPKKRSRRKKAADG